MRTLRQIKRKASGILNVMSMYVVQSLVLSLKMSYKECFVNFGSFSKLINLIAFYRRLPPPKFFHPQKRWQTMRWDQTHCFHGVLILCHLQRHHNHGRTNQNSYHQAYAGQEFQPVQSDVFNFQHQFRKWCQDCYELSALPICFVSITYLVFYF